MKHRCLLVLLLLTAFTITGCLISGKIVDKNGIGIPDVTVTLEGDESKETTTDSHGGYQFGNISNIQSWIPAGKYTVTPSKTGSKFVPSSWTVEIENASGNDELSLPAQNMNFTSGVGTFDGLIGIVVNQIERKDAYPDMDSSSAEIGYDYFIVNLLITHISDGFLFCGFHEQKLLDSNGQTVQVLKEKWKTNSCMPSDANDTASPMMFVEGGDATFLFEIAENENPTTIQLTYHYGVSLDDYDSPHEHQISINFATGNTCSFSISPTSHSISSKGGTGSISVSSTDGCNWSATSSVSWITITSGESGSGNGAVGCRVSANTGERRIGAITVGGRNHKVTQEAQNCSFSIAPISKRFPYTGGSGAIQVDASSNTCSWTAWSDPEWITVTSGNNSTGDGVVRFSVEERWSEATGERSDKITVAGKTFIVIQDAPR